MTAYIDHVQETTLSSYPLTLENQTVDMSALMKAFMGEGSSIVHDNDAIYKDPIIADLVNALAELEATENDLGAFKEYLESEMAKEDSPLKGAISGIHYSYALTPIIYTKNQDGTIIKSDTGELMMEMIGDFMMQVSKNEDEGNQQLPAGGGMSSAMMGSMMGVNMWQELLPGLEKGDYINDILEEQYDVIYGSWPNEKNEIVLVVNEKNEIDDLTLYALGLLSEADIDAIIDAAASGTTLPDNNKSWSYEEICEMTFRAILPYECYEKVGDVFVDVSKNESMLKILYDKAFELNVVGIIRPDPDAETTMLTGSICYTHELTEHFVKESKNAPVIAAQMANPTVDVLTGKPFEENTGLFTDEEKEEAFRLYVTGLSTAGKAKAYIAIQALKAEQIQLKPQVDAIMSGMNNKDMLVAQISEAIAAEMGVDKSYVAERLSELTLDELKDMLRPTLEEQVKTAIHGQVQASFAGFTDEQIAAMLDGEMPTYTTEQCALYYDEVTEFSASTYDMNLFTFGYSQLEKPSAINLYASTFENKDVIVEAINNYNKSVDESRKIAYTDYLGIMMSAITTIINAITYVLIAFVAISMVVSSIMIGVITLISVQERTKEIGILRAIGASKKNVSSMFNAETMIIGFASGLLGVVVTYLLCIPINLILHALTDINTLNAVLPFGAAVILVAISVCLTLISGIIPSRSAAKKDPVVALRSE